MCVRVVGKTSSTVFFANDQMYLLFQDQQNGEKKQDKKKKSTTKLVELPLEGQTHGFDTQHLNNFLEQELKMITNDRQEKERVDAKNALEEFIYDMRGRIQEGGELFEYVNDSNRVGICEELEKLENWLYEEGEDCERQVYKDRLGNLHKQTDPIKFRHSEYTGQPGAVEQLRHEIQLARKSVDQYRAGEERYNHLTETEMLNISEAADKAEKFVNDVTAKLGRRDLTQDPPIKVADITHEYETLKTCVRSVLSRPKPKAPSPPPGENQKAADGNQQQQNGDQAGNTKETGDGKSQQQPEANSTLEDKMDVE